MFFDSFRNNLDGVSVGDEGPMSTSVIGLVQDWNLSRLTFLIGFLCILSKETNNLFLQTFHQISKAAQSSRLMGVNGISALLFGN